MSDPAILEAAARALRQTLGVNDLNSARVVVAAVTPLIRAQALEEAAGVADKWTSCNFDGAAYAIAEDIRVLKEKP